MPSVIRVPNISEVVDPLIGRPYAEYDCWDFVRYVLHAGFGLDVDRDVHQAHDHVCEVWSFHDPRDPFTLLQPWDWLVFITQSQLMMTNHVGLVETPIQFVHIRRKTGVVRESISKRWVRASLFQIARLRIML